MEINISDYLSHEEIKDICKEYVADTIRKGGERLVNNLAYECAWKILDETLTPEHFTLIKEKAEEILKDIKSYSVFRKADAWGKGESIAYIELKKAIDNNQNLIHENVAAVVAKYDYESELRNNADMFSEFLIEALKKGLK